MTDPKPSAAELYRVSVGPYTLELPPNGIAVLYEADAGGTDHRLPGGVGYLDALVMFAMEVKRLQKLPTIDPIEAAFLANAIDDLAVNPHGGRMAAIAYRQCAKLIRKKLS